MLVGSPKISYRFHAGQGDKGMEKRQDRVSAQAAPSSGSLQMLPHPCHRHQAEAAVCSRIPVGSQGTVARQGPQCLMLQGWVFELRPCSRHSGHLQALRPHQFNAHDSRSHCQHCTSLLRAFYGAADTSLHPLGRRTQCPGRAAINQWWMAVDG